MISTYWMITLGLLYLAVQLIRLQILNITGGVDDRVTFYLTFVLMGLVTAGNVGLVFYRILPYSYMGTMIIFFCYITFLMESLVARALGYPSMKTTKLQRIGLVSGSTVCGGMGLVAIFVFFYSLPKSSDFIPELVTKDVFHDIYRNLLVSIHPGEPLFLFFLFAMMIPSFVMTLLVFMYDVTEKRSRATKLNDGLLLIVLSLILFESLADLDIWWFPFLAVQVLYATVFLHLLKEISSMKRRMSLISPSIEIINRTIAMLSKKETLSGVDDFQIGIISRKCIEDNVLNNYLRNKKAGPRERKVLDRIWHEKDRILLTKGEES